MRNGEQQKIKPPGSPIYPGQIFFVSCDTLKSPNHAGRTVHSLKLWCGICESRMKGDVYKTRPSCGKESRQFWDWIEDLHRFYRESWIVSHDLYMDFTVLGGWEWIDRCGWKVESVIIDDPPTVIRLSKGGRSILLVDSLNWFNCSFEDLRESIGIDKDEMKAPRNSKETEWYSAGRRVEVLRLAVMSCIEDLIETHHCSWNVTAGAVAWDSFRRFRGAQSICYHRHPRVMQLEEDAMIGGIVQPMYIGEISSDVYVVDVNSMYPFVMGSHQFPVELDFMDEEPSLDEVMEYCHDFCTIARVRLQDSHSGYGTYLEGRLVWPVGTFDAVLCGPELYHALCSKEIARVYEIACYKRGDPFSEFVSYWYRKRMDGRGRGDKRTDNLAKTVMNSLWGRFAQRREEWISAPHVKAQMDYGFWYGPRTDEATAPAFRSIAGHVQARVKSEFTDTAFPAIAAYVISHGRNLIRSLVSVAKPENVYYIATDALHISRAGFDILEDSGFVDQARIGFLKLSGIFGGAEYRGRDNYTLGQQHHVSGVKADARALGEGVFEQEVCQGFASGTQSRPGNTVTCRRVLISQSRPFVGGNVLPDGRVQAWRLPVISESERGNE